MKRKLLPISIWIMLAVPQVVMAQDAADADLSAAFLLSTLVYSLLGLVLYVAGYLVFDRLFKLDLRRELVEDQNVALGIMMAGVFIGIAILIAAVVD